MFNNQERLNLRAALDQAWEEFVDGTLAKAIRLIRLDVVLSGPREIWTKAPKLELDTVAAFARLAVQEVMVRVAERRAFEEENKG
jgi:hypothetical protein